MVSSHMKPSVSYTDVYVTEHSYRFYFWIKKKVDTEVSSW